MPPTRHSVAVFVALVGLASAACSGQSESEVEVAEEFTAAFIDGDVDELAELSTDLDALGAIPWRAEFLAALDLEADSVDCAEDETQITCMIEGHDARTKPLAPDLRWSVHHTSRSATVSSVAARSSLRPPT